MIEESLLEEPILLTPVAQKVQPQHKVPSTGWPLPAEAYGSIVEWIDDTWGYTYHLTDGRVI